MHLIKFEHIILEATVSNSIAPVRRMYARYSVQSSEFRVCRLKKDFRLLTVDNAKITIFPVQCQTSGARASMIGERFIPHGVPAFLES